MRNSRFKQICSDLQGLGDTMRTCIGTNHVRFRVVNAVDCVQKATFVLRDVEAARDRDAERQEDKKRKKNDEDEDKVQIVHYSDLEVECALKDLVLFNKGATVSEKISIGLTRNAQLFTREESAMLMRLEMCFGKKERARLRLYLCPWQPDEVTDLHQSTASACFQTSKNTELN